MKKSATAEQKIDASPTKEFFISMLVRDIELVDAIADLVDNCVDGARRLRPKGKYEGLWVRIETSAEAFRIADNCGGIDVDTARHYAFRFGRPPGMPLTPHSVGQFGIGMKRALFKLGSLFTVESTTRASRFSLEVDVDEWKDLRRKSEGQDELAGTLDDWTFQFDQLEEGLKVPTERTGTTISVTKLNKGVASEFGLENFENKLVSSLESKHQFSLQGGLAITLNQIPLSFKPAELLQTRQLKPAFRKVTMRPVSKTPITVKLYVGLSDSDPAAGGWYIYCNGRLVLRADQTSTTGWGEGDDVAIPKYHNQYARFRGYAFFDCDDAGLLPWNTSKTDVALDSPVYQAARQQMIVMARGVIDFLNRLKEEEQMAKQTNERPLQDHIDEAEPAGLFALHKQPAFAAPRVVLQHIPPSTQLISYRKPLDQVTKVQKILKVRTLRQVGEGTFDYFFKNECTKG